jgi:hypothetical protein
MKALNLALLMLALAPAALSQPAPDAPDAPGLSVTQPKWRQEVRNPALDEDPFRANNDQREIERLKKEINKENNNRARSGQRDLIRQPRPGSSSIVLDDIRVNYIYEVSVANNGDRPIRALVWEYVLVDPETQAEVGKHRFMSEASIRPGKSKRLVGRSTSPPAGIVTVSKAGKPTQAQYFERVVIHGIEYADGTVWERILK